MNCSEIDEGGEEEEANVLMVLIVVWICFVALSMGCTITIGAVKEVWSSKRRAFVIGAVSQFVLMPFLSFGLAYVFDLASRVAMGVVLVGSAPGGSTSNLLTHWADGNVALSVAMSATSTVCALFMLPLNIAIYINSGLYSGGVGAGLSIPYIDIVVTLLTIVVPVGLGMLLRHANFVCGPTERYRAPLHVWVEKAGNVVGALFLVASVGVSAVEHPKLFNPTEYPAEWCLAALFEPIGCFCGFAMATAARLNGRDSRAVALETGVQNYALIIALISLSFKAGSCEREEVSRFVLISTAWYVVSSAWIITLMRVAARREAQREAGRLSNAAAVKAAATAPDGSDASTIIHVSSIRH